MSKMTIVQLGVILFTICLSTQVVSMANTTAWNSTLNTNATTTATSIHSSSANTTLPVGRGISLHAGTVSFLVPVVTAAAVLQHYC